MKRSMLLILLTTAAMLTSSITAEAQAPAVPTAAKLKPNVAILIYALIFPSGAPVSLLGGPEAWEEQWSVPLPAGATPKDVLKSINEIWAAEKDWTSLKEDRIDSSDMSIWRFTDQTGKSWIATASAESSPTKSGQAFVTLRIVRASTLSSRFVKGTCEL